MRTQNGGGDISHNVQTAAEEKNHFIVAADVTSEAVDYGQLHNISSQAKEELQAPELISIADKGYYTGEQFAKCKEENIHPIAPHPGKRKSMCAHPFGTVKRALAFSYFLTCGTENVRTESLLHFFAYNMKRLINIMVTAKLQLTLQG